MAKRGRKIGVDELTFFNRQLASMARLDLPFPEGLRTLSKEVETPEFRKLIENVLADLEEGKRLSEAVRRHADVFSDLYIGIVEAGEMSGDLAAALEGLANYSESMLFLRQRVRAALAYPLVAMGIMGGLFLFMFTGLVPKFAQIFEALDIALPKLTKFYVTAATVFRDNLGYLAGCVVMLVFAIWMFRRLRAGGEVLGRLGLNLPLYGRMLRQVLLLRFSETLRALLKANVSLVPALQITARTMGSNVVRTTVEDMVGAAEEGRRVSDEMRRNSIFPKTFVWKFALAEEQGTLESTLDELSRYMESEMKTITARFTALLEPFLMMIVGLVIGSVVLSVFLPIFELQKQLAAH